MSRAVKSGSALIGLILLIVCSLYAASHGGDCSEAAQKEKVGSTERIHPAKVYVLAVGACVPWNPQRCCALNVTQVVDVFVEKAHVPRGNIKLLLDSEATHQRIHEGLDWLRRATSPSDAAIFLYVGHGGRLPDTREGKKRDFLHYLTLWSEEEPRSRWSALNRQTWLSSEEFADLFNGIPARTKILLLDTCNAGTFIQPQPGNQHDRIAVIASSRADEPACFTGDKTAALFTFHLLKAIHEGAADLHAAFHIAEGRIVEDSRKVIERIKKEREAEAKEGHPEPLVYEEQVPQLMDPRGVTSMLKFKADKP